MKVYSFVMTLAKNQNDAEDITQKAFLKAMTTDKKIRGEASEFTWLCAIAKNLFIDEYRAKRPIGEVHKSTPSDVDIEKAFVNEETSFRIHQIIHKLDEPYKEVFQLRVFGELSFKKIALIVGKTERWAGVTYNRSRLKIQEILYENE